MIKIVVDSTAYVSRQFLQENGVALAKQNVVLDNVHYIEEEPGTFDKFFEHLIKSQSFAKTAPPDPEEFYNKIEGCLANPEDEVICIVASSGIGGTYRSAMLAYDMFSDEDKKRISVIDTLCAVQLIWTLVKTACKLVNDGWSREKIVEFIENEKHRGRGYLIPHNLEYLKRGGRVSGASALIGTILNIKPIIELNHGKLKPFKKVSGMRKGIEEMVSNMPLDAYNITVTYVYRQTKDYELLCEAVKKKFPDKSINTDVEVGSVTGSHLGPYAIGVIFFDPSNKPEQEID